jgi:lysophospholipase L1-like esterase
MPKRVSTSSSITFLALGDSYTIGTLVAENERWPSRLAEYLHPASGGPAQKHFAATPDIIATKGWTTTDLTNGIRARTDLLPAYDLVSLLIGVNNQYDGFSLEDFAHEFEELLNTAIRLAGDDAQHVFVVSIPDYAFTPSGEGRPQITKAITRFNASARSITERYGVAFLDITPISREGIADTGLVASDGLHPSGKQYQRWVDEVIGRAVRELLER